MMKLQKYFKIKWLILAVTLTATVILFTHIPKELIPSQLQESTFDKFFHFLAYGSITFLLILSVKNPFFTRLVFLVIPVLFAICIVDEITQPLVGRQASFSDFLADVIGIAIGLLFFIIGKRRFQITVTDSISRLCFVSVFCFIAGVLVVVATIVSLNILKGPSLFQRQQAARYFFYTTMLKLFEGDYDLEEGFVSEDALETFKKYRSRFTGKCSLVINNDPYNQSRQWNGHFSGAAIFPSGDYFSVVIVKTNKGFILKKFEPIDWEVLWKEILSDTERYYRLGYSPVYYEL